MGRTTTSTEDGEIEAVRYPKDIAKAALFELPARMAEIITGWEAERWQVRERNETDRLAAYDWMLSFVRAVAETAVDEGRPDSEPESARAYLSKVLRSLQESTQEIHRTGDWSTGYRDTREHLTRHLSQELLDFTKP